MPQKDVASGDTIRLIDGTPGNLYYLEADGDIRLAQTQQFARLARILPANLDAEVTIRDSGVVYAYGEEAATITFDRQGLSWNPRAAEAVTEVNADDSTTIPADDSKTVTTRANQGELWQLQTFSFKFDPTNTDWGGAADDDLTVTVQTEEQNIEIGFFSVGELDESDSVVVYNAGGWSLSGTGNANTSRDNILNDHRIDSDNGIEVVVATSSGAAAEATREIRYSFQVIRA